MPINTFSSLSLCNNLTSFCFNFFVNSAYALDGFSYSIIKATGFVNQSTATCIILHFLHENIFPIVWKQAERSSFEHGQRWCYGF